MNNSDEIGSIRERQERGYRSLNWNAIDQEFAVRVRDVLKTAENGDPNPLDTLKEDLRGRIVETIRTHGAEGLTTASVLKDMLAYVEGEEEERENRGKDALTGLPLRGAFSAQFQRSVERLKRNRYRESTEQPSHLGVLLVDVDHFKSINDTYGHAVGDTVLKEVAARLREACRDGELVVRYGGEEFGIILDSTSGPEGAMHAAERLRQSICARPIFFHSEEEKQLLVTASVGVVTFPLNGFSYDALENTQELQQQMLHKADLALYAAKRVGRNRAQFYNEKLEKEESE